MYNSEVDFPNLVAFVPVYGAEGRVTRLYYTCHTADTDLSIASLVRHACREYSLDRKGLKNAARFVSGNPNLVPLPLMLDRTFFPVKSLSPRIRGDAAYGYYLLQGIVRIEKSDTGCVLTMSNRISFDVLQSRSVVMNHVARSLLFERIFWSKRLGEKYRD